MAHHLSYQQLQAQNALLISRLQETTDLLHLAHVTIESLRPRSPWYRRFFAHFRGLNRRTA